jgi:hypothetical protein
MSISIDVSIDDIVWGMTDYDKQELVDELFDEGFVAKKDPRSDDSDGSDWDEAVMKLLGNKWRLSNEDEETILKIANKIVC